MKLTPVLFGARTQTLQPLRLVERVKLCTDDDLRSLGKVRIVGAQLAVDLLVIFTRIASRLRREINQVQQQLRPLDVAQETITKPRAFVRAFNQAGNVCDDEGAKVAQVNDAEMWLKRDERIVGDLRFRGRDGRDQS